MPSFPKSARLLKPREFASLRVNAQSKGNRYFRLRWLSKEKQRLGVIVSKKVDIAARRNLIKRIIREYFRLNPSLFPQGDVIVIASPVVGALSKKEIWERLKDALSSSKKH